MGRDLMVKVYGCRPSQVAALSAGRRTETAQARTRGVERCRYGDLGAERRRRLPDGVRPLPLAFSAERLRWAARSAGRRCPGVRQADLGLASMAAELAVGFDMQSPDSRSGAASTRDCGSPRRVTTPSSRWTRVRPVARAAGRRRG